MEKFNSVYKIKSMGLLTASYEEMGMSDIIRYDVRELLLKCHGEFYVIEFIHQLPYDRYSYEIFDCKIIKIEDIKDYLLRKKSFNFFSPQEDTVDKVQYDSENVLSGAGFCYSLDKDEFITLNEPSFFRVPFEKIFSDCMR